MAIKERDKLLKENENLKKKSSGTTGVTGLNLTDAEFFAL
jgi:hypothetical protein